MLVSWYAGWRMQETWRGRSIYEPTPRGGWVDSYWLGFLSEPFEKTFPTPSLFCRCLWKTIPTSQVLIDLIHRGRSDYKWNVPRYNACTWKTSFLRLHFWFILIYFQIFFSKIWVAKLGVRLFCECSLYASVYGISLVLCLSHKCEPGFRIQWNTFHDHKITKLYNRTLWAMQHQFQSHPSISPFSPVVLKWTINKEFQPKV